MKTQAFLIHALSPLHAGTGHTPDLIDLPTARMKATGIPFLPGSSIKGVLRDARSNGRHSAEATLNPDQTAAVFGPTDDTNAHAGALGVSDARLLALPVRAFRGTFAWVTSPLLLALAQRDLNAAAALPIPKLSGRMAAVTTTSGCIHRDILYLEDLDLPLLPSRAEADLWANFLAPHASPGEDIFTKRFAIIDDDTMAFLWETKTQIDTRVRIDAATRTVAKGALWLEESLPPETLLLGLFAADRSRRHGQMMTPDEVLNIALPKPETHQFGGKATTGRGRCRIIPLSAKGSTHGQA